MEVKRRPDGSEQNPDEIEKPNAKFDGEGRERAAAPQ
jgi:hypothetical protein